MTRRATRLAALAPALLASFAWVLGGPAAPASADARVSVANEVGEVRELGAVVVAVTTDLRDGVPLDRSGEHRQTEKADEHVGRHRGSAARGPQRSADEAFTARKRKVEEDSELWNI